MYLLVPLFPVSMSPVSPVFYTDGIVSFGLKTSFRVGTSIPQIVFAYHFSSKSCKSKKMEKGHFNEHLKCAAPKHWAKYTKRHPFMGFMRLSLLLESRLNSDFSIIQE